MSMLRTTAAVLLATAAVTIVAAEAAARRPAPRTARIESVGTAVAPADGWRWAVPFRVGEGRRAVRVDFEVGFDRDGDGVIADGSDPSRPSEFTPATLDRLDPRTTAERSRKGKFAATRAAPTDHVFVWNARLDVRGYHDVEGRLVTTADGRPVVDPERPGAFLREPGVGGVRLRARTVVRRLGRLRRTEWVESDRFTLDAHDDSSVALDDVAASDLVSVSWRATNPTSEDDNGNGVLDILDGEDRNLDGRLDAGPVAVAFDHAVLPDGFDVVSASDAELAALDWSPAQPAVSSDPTIDVPTSPTLGEAAWTFAWDWRAAEVPPGARVFLRARAWDGEQHSAFAYAPDAVVLPSDAE